MKGFNPNLEPEWIKKVATKIVDYISRDVQRRGRNLAFYTKEGIAQMEHEWIGATWLLILEGLIDNATGLDKERRNEPEDNRSGD